ncbi:MAG: PAS domain S-box protein, partial [Deltaproteobacteria bacterium]|nr:PAS domain S-box protein [Deltaproteobacteria bacterium]
DFNERFVHAFGFTQEDVPALTEWWQPADSNSTSRFWVEDTWETAVDQATEGKTDINPVEYRVTCKNGSVRTVMISGARLGNNFLVALFDMTEKKQAEEALRESEERHRALIHGLPDIVMRLDREARHLFVSNNIEEVTGIAASQLVGKTHAELGFPEWMSSFWEDAVH